MANSSRLLFDHFNSRADVVNWTNAYLLCMASRLAYFDARRAERTLAGWGLEDPLFLSHKDRRKKLDTQSFVASKDKSVLVVFRGTEPTDIKDWLTDLRLKQVRRTSYDGKVHRGFADALQISWSDLAKQVSARLRAGAQDVWFAGHSLGGALATLAAHRFARKGVPVAALYTYGCPRVGDRDFVRAMKMPNYRFENNHDLVAKVPLELTLGLEYEHFGSPLYFTRKGKLLRNTGSKERKRDIFLSAIRSIVESGIDGIEDHGLDRYAMLIKKRISNRRLSNQLRLPFANFW